MFGFGWVRNLKFLSLFFVVWVASQAADLQSVDLTNISSFQEAEALVRYIEERVPANVRPSEVEMVILDPNQSHQSNRYLKWAWLLLESKKIKVTLQPFSLASTDELAAQLEALQSHPTTKALLAVESSGKKVDSPHFHRISFKKSVGFFKQIGLNCRVALNRLLGMSPQGFTLLSHFWLRHPSTKGIQKAFVVPKGQWSFCKSTALVSLYWLAASKLFINYAFEKLQNGASVDALFSASAFVDHALSQVSVENLAMAASIYGWVAGTLYISQSLFSFRSQHKMLAESKNEPNSLTTKTSSIWFLLHCFAQDLLWNQFLLGLQTQLGTLPLTLQEVTKRTMTAFFSAASYSALEKRRGELMQLADEVESHDEQLANEIRVAANQQGSRLWKWQYPFAFNMAIFLPGPLAPLPLIALGTYGLLAKESKSITGLRERAAASSSASTQISFSPSYKGCPLLLVLKAR